MRKDLLVILKNSPYRTECSKLALNLAITFATFDQKISVLIIGDGCFQLHPDQNTGQCHHRNHLKTLKSLFVSFRTFLKTLKTSSRSIGTFLRTQRTL